MKNDQLPEGVSFHSSGEGNLGSLIGRKNWGETSLGPLESWPGTLQGYVNMILALPAPAIIFWGEDQVQIYNDGYSEIMGPRHPYYLGATYKECWPDTYPTIYPWMERVLRKGEGVKVDRTLFPLTRYGFNEEAFFTFSFGPLQDDHGKIAGILQIVHEVTEAVLTDRRLETIRTLASYSLSQKNRFLSHAIRTLSANPKDIRFALFFMPSKEKPNQLTLEKSFGIGESSQKIIFSKNLFQRMEEIFKLNRSREIMDIQELIPHSPLPPWPETTHKALALPIKNNETETPQGVVLLGISPRLKFDEKYREFYHQIAREVCNGLALDQEKMTIREAEKERQDLHRFFMEAPIAICVFEGPHHTFTLANEAYYSLLGGKRMIIGKPIREALPEIGGQGYFELLDQVYQKGESFIGREFPVTITAPEGLLKKIFADFILRPSKNFKGQVDGIVAIATDVSDQVLIRKRIEESLEALRESENRFRSLFKQAIVGVLQTDLRGKIELVNEYFAHMVGRPPEELYKMRIQDITHPDDHHVTMTLFEKMILKGENFTIEKRFICPNGSIVWVNNAVSLIRDRDDRPQYVTIVSQDITERKRIETHLQESETYFRNLVDTAPAIIWITDPSGYCSYLSQQWYDYTGRTPELDLGFGWVENVHPDDRQKAHDIFLASNDKRIPFGIEYRLARKDGAYRWVLDSGRPRFDSQGNFQGHIGSVFDIHEMKTAENKLRQALTARDEFLSIASHELKTPLTTLKLKTQSFQRKRASGHLDIFTPEIIVPLIDKIEKQTSRLTRLVDDMLDIARIATGKLSIEKEQMALCELIKEVIDRFRPFLIQAGTPAELDGLEPIEGFWDKFRIEQVLTNLLTNAMQYGGAKPITIKLEKIKNNTARLSVKDRGIGIAKEAQKRIFNRFERAVDARNMSGLGLGLFITRQIVEQHGGKIWVESKLGEGSTFFAELPIQSPSK